MASYPLICIAFLVICSFSIIETGSATRSGPTSKSDSLVHVESEPVTPPRTTSSNNDDKGLKQSVAQVVGPAYPNYYPYSGPGNPYYGQPGQPYFPNYRSPLVFPTIGGPFSSPYSYPGPYSTYNPTPLFPYGPGGPGSNIYGPGPSDGDARVSSKARP